MIVDETENDFIKAGKTVVKGREMNAPKAGAGAEMLGFGSAPAEEEEF